MKKWDYLTGKVPINVGKKVREMAMRKGMSLAEFVGSLIVRALPDTETGMDVDEAWQEIRKLDLKRRLMSWLNSKRSSWIDKKMALPDLIKEVKELEAEGVDVTDLLKLLEAFMAELVLVNPVVYKNEPGCYLLIKGSGREAIAKAVFSNGTLVFIRWKGIKVKIMAKLLGLIYQFRNDMTPEEAAREVERRAEKAGVKIEVKPLDMNTEEKTGWKFIYCVSFTPGS